MGRLALIEERLIALNEAAFQELCDTYIVLKNPRYRAFSRPGAKAGKEKTKIGTPDSFALLPDGKYLFVEITTQQTDLIKKFTGDISNCIDESKTGIPVSKIREIILCANSKLGPKEIEIISEFANSKKINVPTIITLDELAIQIHLQHRHLAKIYLEIPLDTGQIVSLDTFVKDYNSSAQSIATPIDNPFHHRSSELQDLVKLIDQNDFIIINGPPGVGKTRIALEGIGEFLKKRNEYTAYAIENRHFDIFEDLPYYFNGKSKNILFVDDANRIDRLSQIVGFTQGAEKGSLKIILTVRDYAFEQLERLIPSPAVLPLENLTEDEIIDIVKNPPFNITNTKYHPEILKISEGNPRLAIMAARLALKEQTVSALYEVYDLYDDYFKTYVRDNGLLQEKDILKSLGILAFFNVLPCKKSTTLEDVLNKFSMSIDAFLDSMDKLESIELVEIRFDHVRISEQTLSTYFFYKAVFKEEVVSFGTLIDNYFESHRNRLKDTVIPSNNTFGYRNIRTKIRPHLLRKLETLSTEKQVIGFFELFWFYLEDELLSRTLGVVEMLAEPNKPEYFTKLSSEPAKDEYLKLMFQVIETHPSIERIEQATTIAIEYSRKLPATYGDLVDGLSGHFSFDYDDEPSSFERQKALFKIVYQKLDTESYYQDLFLDLAVKFLRFQFEHGKALRGHKFSIYRYALPVNDSTKEFRDEIWVNIERIFQRKKEKVFGLLRSYTEARLDANVDLLTHDLPSIMGVIARHLSSDEFKHCFVVQELFAWLKRLKVDVSAFNQIKDQFLSTKYLLFRKLDMNRLRDKEIHDFDNYEKYKEIKEREIRASFKFNSVEEFDTFINTYHEISKFRGEDYELRNSLRVVLDENVTNNPELSLKIFRRIIENPQFSDTVPYLNFETICNQNEHYGNQFWSLIKPQTWLNDILDLLFGRKSQTTDCIESWRLDYLLNLSSERVNRYYLHVLKSTLKNLRKSQTLFLSGIEKYQKINKDVIHEIAGIVIQHNRTGKIKVALQHNFFEKYGALIREVKILKEIYLQQDSIQHMFDFDGADLLIVLKRDQNFLLEYLRSIGADNKSRDHRNMRVVWELDNPTDLVKRAVNYIIDLDRFNLGLEFLKSFLTNNTPEIQPNVDEFIVNFISEYNRFPKKVSPIIELINSSRAALLQRALTEYLKFNPSLEDFQKIEWIENGAFIHDGKANLGDIKSSRWQKILSMIDAAGIGLKAIPLQNWINQQIEYERQSADHLRQLTFLGKW